MTRARIGQHTQTRQEAFDALPAAAQHEVTSLELNRRTLDLEQQAREFIRSTPAAKYEDPAFQTARLQAERDPLAQEVSIEIDGQTYLAVGLPGQNPLVALVGPTGRLPTLSSRAGNHGQGTPYSNPDPSKKE